MSQSGSVSSVDSSDIITINGDTGSITGHIVTIYADNATQNSGSSVLFVNSGTVSTLDVTDSNQNTIIGNGSGNASISGSGNVSLGDANFPSLSSGSHNVSIGQNSGHSVSSGASNTFIGTGSGSTISTTSNNTAVGYNALTSSIGSNNVVIGYSAGSTYASTESNNILIGNTGSLSDANIIRIGAQGSGSSQQNQCYVAGIIGTTVSNEEYVTIDSVTGQLGVTTVSSGLYDYTGVTHGTSPYTAVASDLYIGCDSSGGTVVIKLPDAPTKGRFFIVKDSGGTTETNAVSVTTVSGTDYFDNPITTTYTFTVNYQSAQFIFNGTYYEVF